jgi:hypothetical protein
VELREVKPRICPAECTNLKLGHAGDVEIDFVGIITDSIDILKVYSMEVAGGIVNRISPGKRIIMFREI